MNETVEVLPLGWSESGEPVSVPPGASGWRVKLHRPGAKKPALVRDARGIPTVIPLQATPDEFRAVVGVGGRYRLEPVFSDGRSIADSEPAIIILQEEEPKEKATSNLGSNDALILKLIEGHHESIARTHELMNEMVADHRAQVTALAEQNTKLVASMADRFGSYLSGTAKLLEATSPPPPPEPPRNALETLGDFKKIRELCADLGETAITGEAEAPYTELVTEGVRTALPLLTQLIHKCVLGLSPEQTAALTGSDTPPAEQPSPAPAASQPQSKATTDFVAHLNAIEKHLTPNEAKAVRSVIATMSPEQIKTWKRRIVALPPKEAAAHIRERLHEEKKEAPS